MAQLQLVDEAGCAGATVFSWTDEWGVAGSPGGGLGFRDHDDRSGPKPAAEVVGEWARSAILDVRQTWPLVSVVVCAYNEQRTIERVPRVARGSTYPALEVLVCDDGSTDRTLELVRRFPFRVLELPHGGLSAARNAGLAAARGDIVAYLDADAMCHPDWPFHLAMSLEDEGVVATGGPNLPFADAGLVEHAVAASPGGPVEVLIRDDRAEHVPGCNMAFRAEELRAIGGFDVTYTSAGDDVDVCWKLLDRGGEIAFAPAAQVRHHRRRTVGAYLRQQRGYGRSERMVAAAHPHVQPSRPGAWRGASMAAPHCSRRSCGPSSITGTRARAVPADRPLLFRHGQHVGLPSRNGSPGARRCVALARIGVVVLLAHSPASPWLTYGCAIVLVLRMDRRPRPDPWRCVPLLGRWTR